MSELSGLHYWILDGHEPRAVRHKEYVKWMERGFEETRRVAETFVGEARVSTVFLTIDHNFGWKGPPVLFETMIFGGLHDEGQWRYCSWDEAEAGHARIVAALTAGRDPDEDSP